jgi:hypothetical protein
MLTVLTENWQSNAWVNSVKQTYSYDNNGNMVIELNEAWQSNAWVNSVRKTYTYDTNGNSLTGIYEKWQYGNWASSMGTLYLYSQNQYISHLDFVYRYEASFKSDITGLPNSDPRSKTLSVFPNPATEKITIETPALGDISVLNLNGRQILQQEITEPATTIDVSILKSGIYVVRVTGEKNVGVVKFIKQ